MRALLIILAASCSPNPASSLGSVPEVTGIEPAVGRVDEATPVVITGRGFTVIPRVSFRSGESFVDDRFSARLGDAALDEVRFRDSGSLTARVPAGLAVALYDLSITDPAGRSAGLPGAFLVVDDTGVDNPDIDVRYAGNPVAPSSAIDLGTVTPSDPPFTATFAIANVGAQPLTVSAAITSTGGATFDLTQPSSPLAPAGQSDLVVTVTPQAAGSATAIVTVTSNDPDESPYPFTLNVDVLAWWDNDWPVRHGLTFDNALQTADDLVDFPVLITLDDTIIDYGQTATGGADLRFIDGTGTELAYEIEEWNPSGASQIWVKVPLIPAASTDTTVDLYYGNQSAAAGARPAEVWSNGFAAVYHLNGDLLDSAANANHGANSGSTAGAGVVAGGRWFDFASVHSVEIDDVGFPTGATPRTLCAWAQTPTIATDVKHWFISYGRFTTNGGFFIGRVRDELWCGGVGNDIIANNVWQLDAWQYMCCTHDGTNANLYVDGAHVQGPANKSAWDVELDRAFLGNHINSGESWDGGMDEARISTVERSPDWLAAEHASMIGAFVTIGAAETL